jgi:4-amino-4-deoxy-L-arabinose transferase-like glycosyltransferase
MINSFLALDHASDGLHLNASARSGGARQADWPLAVVLLGFVLGLQIFSGAYRADFDSNDDEAAHAVSSLMVRDYLVSGNLTHPWKFAENFYIHYPKVAILHWPPLFHSCEAAWMLAVGRSRFGLVSFQALLAATLVIGLFFWMRRDYGIWLSFLSALVLAAIPTIQDAAREVSPDLLLAVLVFWASAQYGLYLTNMKSRHAWWAGLLAVAALGTHGRAAVLFMVPPITLLLVRLTWKRIAAAVAILLVFVFVPAIVGQAYSYSPANTLANSLRYLTLLAAALNWYIFALALIGIAAGLRADRPRTPMAAITALVLSCWIFYSVVNVPFNEFFLVTSIPAMIVLEWK